jgi:casein kinase 1
MERVLQDLAKLDLRADARPVLGDRTGVVNTPPAPAPALGARKVSKPGSKPGSQGAAPARPKPSPAVSETIVISDSDSEAENVRDKVPEGTRLPKAVQLRGIAAAASKAADNLALAHAVGSFARVLADTGSRSVTREGFAVLDTLVRQLADPSVFVTPLRGARVRAGAAAENAPRAPRYEKMSRLAELRREVAGAGTNAELARLVQDFGKVIDASNGRTITKDGYAFLDALGTRLKALA